MMTHEITPVLASQMLDQLDAFATLLVDTVADGAAISFLHPLPFETARAFWRDEVAPELAANRRTCLAAHDGQTLIGTVQLLTAMPPNQPHRAEIAKMMVHPTARRQGLGRALMQAALELAHVTGKTLVTLDTRTGDPSQSLYTSVGFETAGIIPGFALDPDGTRVHSTTYMYKKL